MTLIEARDLVKSYSETAERLDVIKGLNLKIEEGEMLAVTGESGSGKREHPVSGSRQTEHPSRSWDVSKSAQFSSKMG